MVLLPLSTAPVAVLTHTPGGSHMLRVASWLLLSTGPVMGATKRPGVKEADELSAVSPRSRRR